MRIVRPRAGRVGCPPPIHTPACRVAGSGPRETRVLLSKKEVMEAWQKVPHREYKEPDPGRLLHPAQRLVGGWGH